MASYSLEKCKHGMRLATCAYCAPRAIPSTAPATASPNKENRERLPRPELGGDLLAGYVPGLRQRLIEAAKKRQVVFYGEIMNDFGGRGHIGTVLDEVNRQQHINGQPLLSALAVLKDTGKPSEGFWTLFEELFPGKPRAGFWEAECERIWSYKW
jgi:hypothetical protein